MHVHKLIFRLDFSQPCFEMIDSPGRTMRLIHEMGDKFWGEFQDSSATRTTLAKSLDKESGVARNIAVEPTQLNVSLESSEGLEFDHILDSTSVATMLKGVHSICDAYKIKTFSRAGLRFIVFDNVPKTSKDTVSSFTSLVDSQLGDLISTTLGAVNDLGFLFVGKTNDKLNYRLAIGPCLEGEVTRHISSESIASKIETGDSAPNFVADIDFFETDFDMTVRASQWCKEPVHKAQAVLNQTLKLLQERK